MRKMASIHRRLGKVYIQSDSKTQSGFWVGAGPLRVLDQDQVDEIAAALRLALGESTHGTPAPRPTEDLTRPFREAAGVKSWASFVKAAQAVGARQEKDEIILTPYRRVDRVGNYVPLPEKARVLPVDSEDLGRAVLSTFDDAN